MNRENKITEGQIQLDDRNNYQPLDKPMVGDTFQRVKHLINSLRQAGCIDEMTAKWFNQTPDPAASNSSVLYPHENSQTDISRKTYHIWVWWPNRTPIIIPQRRRQSTPANSTNTGIVS